MRVFIEAIKLYQVDVSHKETSGKHFIYGFQVTIEYKAVIGQLVNQGETTIDFNEDITIKNIEDIILKQLAE